MKPRQKREPSIEPCQWNPEEDRTTTINPKANMKESVTIQFVPEHEPKRMSRLLAWLLTGMVVLTGSTLVRGQSFVTVTVPFDPSLAIVRDSDQLVVSWQGEGVLESAPFPLGPWTSTGVTNGSYLISPEGVPSFFRVRNPHPRSVQLFVPSAADAGTPLPLVILLHGYSGNGPGVENAMKFLPVAEARGFFYCYPNGTLDASGYRGWSSDPAPDDCLHPGSRVDDIAFLRSLINEIVRTQGADPQQVYLIGHSNGGDMAYRMAHDESALIAGIASLAGPDRAMDNSPSQPVGILHIHGTADTVILYGGGATIGECPAAYPGATAIIEAWANYNGANGVQTEAQPSMDLLGDVPGLDTIITRYTNAPAGGAVELWTIQGGPHVPSAFSSEFAPAVADWLLSHPRPVQ